MPRAGSGRASRISAQRIFEEKLARFTQQGGERIDQLLRPLREELGGFRQLVETGLRLDAEQRGLLRGELEQMRRLNERLSAEAEGLARALRGEFRTRGLWGELVLERVLESAGLERGREYELQRTVRDEEGGRRRPDAVVYLPEGRQVLIDAKAPLAAFLRACEAAEEESRRAALAQHARALKEHLRELGGRGYEAAGESGTVEMVLLFVPSEAALAEALREDPSLQTRGARAAHRAGRTEHAPRDAASRVLPVEARCAEPQRARDRPRGRGAVRQVRGLRGGPRQDRGAARQGRGGAPGGMGEARAPDAGTWWRAPSACARSARPPSARSLRGWPGWRRAAARRPTSAPAWDGSPPT
ncbi:MAG: DNA recombination protein RmuC [Xanthomonadales bacterium]|nr:DNA recombination protein RmuC [Xanthomonadales bacterium]